MIDTIIKYIDTEISALRAAPAAHLTTAIIVAALLWLAIGWRFDAIIDNQTSRIESLNSENSRLRDALGIDHATPSALLSLSNRELRAKALNVVTMIREIDAIYERERAAISDRKDIDDTKKENLTKALVRESDQKFAREA